MKKETKAKAKKTKKEKVYINKLVEVYTDSSAPGKKTVHDYDMLFTTSKEGNDVITLHYSDSKSWTDHTKGQKIMTVTDTGDDVGFEFEESFDFKKLGYDQMFYMQVVFKYMYRKPNDTKIKYVELGVKK
jgi:hypothetical protein